MCHGVWLAIRHHLAHTRLHVEWVPSHGSWTPHAPLPAELLRQGNDIADKQASPARPRRLHRATADHDARMADTRRWIGYLTEYCVCLNRLPHPPSAPRPMQGPRAQEEKGRAHPNKRHSSYPHPEGQQHCEVDRPHGRETAPALALAPEVVPRLRAEHDRVAQGKRARRKAELLQADSGQI